ncbi:MAG: uracil-DNA glycosylase [Acidobacteriaceae bacterium]
MSSSHPISQPSLEAARRQLHAYLDFLRDMGIYDLYHRAEPATLIPEGLRSSLLAATLPIGMQASAAAVLRQTATNAQGDLQPAAFGSRPAVAAGSQRSPTSQPTLAEGAGASAGGSIPRIEGSSFMAKPPSLDVLAPYPARILPAAERPAALQAVRQTIGECTRCPLAYAGRHSIVFADGDPNARLMFVGEGPGADEDASGVPFVGKAGQLLNNMIAAMGLKREEVYIANIVKCRPPGNRTPEFLEATTCSQFLLQQIDIVHPEVIVALGQTAATYLLGVKQSLASMRGRWQSVRGAKVMVTYHPAYLLRDPRQKAEAWKDLKIVMTELGLTPPQRPS